jgi:hypothetical protein
METFPFIFYFMCNLFSTYFSILTHFFSSSLAPFTMYQKPVIDHCPWPSSQFNKWHAQNKLLSSSLIGAGSREQPLVHPPSNQRTIVAARLVFYIFPPSYESALRIHI